MWGCCEWRGLRPLVVEARCARGWARLEEERGVGGHDARHGVGDDGGLAGGQHSLEQRAVVAALRARRTQRRVSARHAWARALCSRMWPAAAGPARPPGCDPGLSRVRSSTSPRALPTARPRLPTASTRLRTTRPRLPIPPVPPCSLPVSHLCSACASSAATESARTEPPAPPPEEGPAGSSPAAGPEPSARSSRAATRSPSGTSPCAGRE